MKKYLTMSGHTTGDSKGGAAENLLPLLGAVALLLVVLFQMNSFNKLYHSSQHDLRAYLGCAHNIVAGRDIYTTHHQAIPEDPTLTSDVPRYIYPPMLGMLMIPATSVPYDTFKHWWFFANFFFVLHALLLCAKAVTRHKVAWGVALCGGAVVLASDPFSWLLRTAQADGLAIYLSVAGFYLFSRQKWWSSALLLALASWIKLTPGLFLVYLVAHGNRKFFVAALVSGVGLGLAQLAIGPAQFAYFFTDTLFDLPNVLRPPAMQSLQSLTTFLMVPARGVVLFDHPDAVPTVVRLGKIVLVIISGVLLVRRPSDHFGRYAGFAACAGVSLLVTDISWMMRCVWNLVMVAGLLMAVLEHRGSNLMATGLASALLLLLGLGSPVVNGLDPSLSWRSLFVAGPGLLALLATPLFFFIAMGRSQWSPWVTLIGTRLASLVKRTQ